MGKRKSAYLAIDMGAESARAIVGRLENGVIKTEEIHRWPSRNISVQGVQYFECGERNLPRARRSTSHPLAPHPLSHLCTH